VGTNLAQLKYDLFQNNWLVFVVFFIYNFHLSFTALHYLLQMRKLTDFLFLNCILDMSFRCYFPVFSQMLSTIVKELKFMGNPKTLTPGPQTPALARIRRLPMNRSTEPPKDPLHRPPPKI